MPIPGSHLLDTNIVIGLLRNDSRIISRIGKPALRSRGTPIPENDLWIAALAIQHDLTLVTRDSHFRLVKEVRTVSWTE